MVAHDSEDIDLRRPFLSPAPPQTPLSPSFSRMLQVPRRKLWVTALVVVVFASAAFFSTVTSAYQKTGYQTDAETAPMPPYAPSVSGLVSDSPSSHPPPPAPAITTAEPVVFSLITWSEASAIETALLMKSALMYASGPVDFHIVCDDDAKLLLEDRLSLLTHPTHPVRVEFYVLTWQAMLDRIEREGSIKSDHSAGLPGLMKLFLHEILPVSVKRAIFVDTDAIFISDPALLMDEFTRLRPSTAAAIPHHYDQSAPEWFHASRICSCVMLLNLEKLREVRLMDSILYRDSYPTALSPAAFHKMYGPPDENTGKYDNVRLGDQGYWWAIVDGRRDIIEPLNFDFEVTSCLLDMYGTSLGDDARTEEEELATHIHTKDTLQEGKVVLPKLLHFNCLHGTPIYMEWEGWNVPDEPLNQRWGPALRYHDGYKWIWLNKAKHGPSKMHIEEHRNVMFADEVWALEHGI